jgi:hypothetical protein
MLVRRHVTARLLCGRYKGGWPTVIGVVPYAGINFCMHEVHPPLPPPLPSPPPPSLPPFLTPFKVFKSYAQEIPFLCQPPASHDVNDPNATTQRLLRIPTRLACGALAGAIGQTFVYPLDTVPLASVPRHYAAI